MSVAKRQLFVAKGMFSAWQIVHSHLLVSVAGIPSLQEGPGKVKGRLIPKAPLATHAM